MISVKQAATMSGKCERTVRKVIKANCILPITGYDRPLQYPKIKVLSAMDVDVEIKPVVSDLMKKVLRDGLRHDYRN